jgi:hypothetical protein
MASQLARTPAKSAGSQTHIAKIEIKGGPDGIVIVVVRRDGERPQIGRQVLDLRQIRRGRLDGVGPPDGYGMTSLGGARFWPAETRSDESG